MGDSNGWRDDLPHKSIMDKVNGSKSWSDSSQTVYRPFEREDIHWQLKESPYTYTFALIVWADPAREKDEIPSTILEFLE